MKTTIIVIAVLAVSLFAAVACAAEFAVYPEAKIDLKATKDANDMLKKARMTGKTTVFTTSEPFAKVAAFYKGLSKEYLMPRASGVSGKPKKHKGYDLYEAYFIFDNANDLMKSKRWVKAQKPAIGLYAEDLKSGKIRDMTVIILSEK